MKHITVSDLITIYNKMLDGVASEDEIRSFKDANATMAIDIDKLKKMVEFERNSKK